MYIALETIHSHKWFSIVTIITNVVSFRNKIGIDQSPSILRLLGSNEPVYIYSIRAVWHGPVSNNLEKNREIVVRSDAAGTEIAPLATAVCKHATHYRAAPRCTAPRGAVSQTMPASARQ